MGLELSTSAGPLAGEGRVGEVWEEGRVGGRAQDLPSATGSSTLNRSWAALGEPGEGAAQPVPIPKLPQPRRRSRRREESVGNSGRAG